MIEIISGTNRPNSNSLKVANLIKSRYDEINVKAQVLDLCLIPESLFSPSSYDKKPKEFEQFKDRIVKSKGLHIVVAEYNGSFPGALKYFIDHLPFPEAFENRKVTYTGVSAGIWGGIRAVEQLQMIFGYRNAFNFPERTFISAIHKKLKEDRVDDELIESLLTNQIKNFSQFIEKLEN